MQRIVEHKDATPAERAIREWYAGFLAGNASRLAGWLAKIANRNAQKEYYLTDVIGIAAASGAKVSAVKATDAREVAGVNSREELAILERAYQNAQAKRLLASGVALADLWRVDVRGELTCGHDVAIDVNCVFEGRVQAGRPGEDRAQLRPARRDDSAPTRRCSPFPCWRMPKSAPGAASGPTHGCARARCSRRMSISATSSK